MNMHYDEFESNESLILEPEDWSDEEWGTICKLFGMHQAERIVVKNYKLEVWGSPKWKGKTE